MIKEQINHRDYIDDLKFVIKGSQHGKIKTDVPLTEKQGNFGILFHTFFRKYTDSTGSSIVYNVIDLLGLEWHLFIKALYEKGVIRKKICLLYTPLGISPLINLLHIGFEMMEENDFKCLDAYIRENK